MSFTPTTRKNSSHILFTFNSIVDLKLGVVNYLRKHIDEFSPRYINRPYLESDNEEYLKEVRMKRMDLDPVKMAFKGLAAESYDDLYREILDRHYDEVINYAPETNMVRLINMYNKFGIIQCTVLCMNQLEESFVNEKFQGKALALKAKYYKDVIVRDYARIVLGDIIDLLKFKNVRLLHIAILNFTENFIMSENPITHEKERVFIPQIGLVYSDNNVLEIIDPYTINGGS